MPELKMLVATSDIISPEMLRDVLGEEDTPEADASPIQVCAGEWRYEDGRWRFYEDDEWEA
jgi:hypothetical protein